MRREKKEENNLYETKRRQETESLETWAKKSLK